MSVSKAPKAKPATEGGRQLSEVGTRKKVARDVGVSPRSVIGWITGEKLPDETNTAKLEELYGIPRLAWQQEPATGELPGEPGEPASEGQGSAADLRAQRRRLLLRVEEPGLSATARNGLERLIVTNAVALAKLEDERPDAATEGEALIEAVAAALDDHPLASAEVAFRLGAERGAALTIAYLRASFPREVAAIEAANKALLEACAAFRAELQAARQGSAPLSPALSAKLGAEQQRGVAVVEQLLRETRGRGGYLPEG